jgi:hypothetical protein
MHIEFCGKTHNGSYLEKPYSGWANNFKMYLKRIEYRAFN